jgi:hypothetical protein
LPPSSRFCKSRKALAERWGEECVLSGDYPGNAPKNGGAMAIEPLEPEGITGGQELHA